MKRIKLILAYDGTNYHGWQIQDNALTIEEVLRKAVQDLLKEEVMLMGASRTDSGVHALGNVVVFDTESRIPADKYSIAINQRLPEDIRVMSSSQVADDFHPRYRKGKKTYEYLIENRLIASPITHRFSHHVHNRLDVEKMKEAATYLIGEHDFKSFCAANSQVKTTIRNVHSIDIEQNGTQICVRVCGNGFLYNMVRIITGTLLEVGKGYYPPQEMIKILAATDRSAAGATAPAKGLKLVEIAYDQDDFE